MYEAYVPLDCIRLTVIDTQTEQPPDTESIAISEPWAKYLVYTAINCFALTEYGDLVLLDDRGSYAYCPKGRFRLGVFIREA